MKDSGFFQFTFLLAFLCVNLFSCQCQQVSELDVNLVLQADTVETLTLRPNKVVTLSLARGGNASYGYAMVQFHCQRQKLTLSSSQAFDRSNSKTGLDVGIVVPLNNATPVLYLKSTNTTDSIIAIGTLHFLTNHDPLPGGCNEIFSLENDPSIEVTYSDGRTDLLFQWSNIATTKLPDCDDSQVQKVLEYDVYAFFMDPMSLSEDDYLDSLGATLKLSSVAGNSRKVMTLKNDDSAKPQLSVASEFGRGVVYSIVVRIQDSDFYAPYIAAVSYSCSFEAGDCSVKLSTGEIILIIVSTVVGGFLLFLGHRMFKLSQFIFGYGFTFLLVSILLLCTQTTGYTNAFIIAGCLGLVGGLLWLSLWLICGFPIASVFLPGLCAGYLLAATVFFTPFGRLEWWERDGNYAMAFMCVVLLFAVLLMAYSKFLNILSCCLVGAYMLLMVAAIPLHSSLCMLMTFAFRRQTIQSFGLVKMVVPTLTQDIVLMVMWPVLVIVGVVFQLYRQNGRPDFDVPKRRRIGHFVSEWRRPLYEGDLDVDEREAGEQVNDERERLIPGPSRHDDQHYVPSYSSVEVANGFHQEVVNPRRKERNLLR